MKTFKKLTQIFIVVIVILTVKTVDAMMLIATDGKKDAYQDILDAGFMYEIPKNSLEHITKLYDDELKKYVFAFKIYALVDDDRGILNIKDRQRVEIKTYGASPDNLVAKKNETLLISYKMRLPKGFRTTKKFCHLHQLKGIDNKEKTADVQHPLMTLTACAKKDGQNRLELRYFDRQTRKMSVATSAPLDKFLDNWVEITELVTFGENNFGKYRITINRIKDNATLLSYNNNSIDLWQTNCNGMRPKFGIYRSLGENKSLSKVLRDEEVRFADLLVEKVK